ncbi:MAG: AraC family transcriptional regulator [Pseudonocardiales bacterium]|nr:MAG: AraC family transcriptional regulator [Pseudonocardiales bacterium]
MHRVAVLALADVVVFDLAIAAQVFDHDDQRDHYAVEVCGLGAGAAVPTSTGFPIVPPAGLDGLRRADTVIVPGYEPHLEPPPRAVLDELRAASGRGARVVSICTGAFALAAAGLLDGRRATTHWHHTAELADNYPRVRVDPDVLYIDDGCIATSAGVAAGIDLCLHLLRTDRGAETATQVARRLVVSPHRSGGQAQLLERPLPPNGRSLADTCRWACEHLEDPLQVADLALHAGHAPRTFVRLFRAQTGTTPMRWLTAQRVHEARRLLEGSDRTIANIAHRTGLGTAANLRTHLGRDTMTTPSAYRQTFQGR